METKYLKIVTLKLRKKEDFEVYEEFQEIVKENASDVTKTTKKLWKEYIRRNKLID